jgi:hypothetical protein
VELGSRIGGQEKTHLIGALIVTPLAPPEWTSDAACTVCWLPERVGGPRREMGWQAARVVVVVVVQNKHPLILAHKNRGEHGRGRWRLTFSSHIVHTPPSVTFWGNGTIPSHTADGTPAFDGEGV